MINPSSVWSCLRGSLYWRCSGQKILYVGKCKNGDYLGIIKNKKVDICETFGTITDAMNFCDNYEVLS